MDGAPALLIRLARPSEAPALLEVFRRSVRSAAAADYSPEQIDAWASDSIDLVGWTARRLAKPTFVATRAERIVGFSDLEPDGHIDMLFVDAGQHRRGIATALLRHVEMQARIANLTRLYAEVSLTARSVFERQGFRVLARQTVTTRGQSFINHRMDKALR